ncbi:hypothetical protein C0Z18_22635 [Trinickia dabaoshanensis]|uniref:Uncharacterized protein n=1 Tax=Trinickia dabaoshanensis TaxID=564714 RepID=A0A2N7VHL9_9BURK|nr:hypothetical protein C0Z18_22635 [Trinickia dabaoshanensis]
MLAAVFAAFAAVVVAAEALVRAAAALSPLSIGFLLRSINTVNDFGLMAAVKVIVVRTMGSERCVLG